MKVREKELASNVFEDHNIFPPREMVHSVKLSRFISGISAVALVTATTTVPVAQAQSSSSSSSNFGSSRGERVDPTQKWVKEISDGLEVVNRGDLLQPGVTDKWGIVGTDLGAMAPLNAGEEFAIIFGDSFSSPRLGGAWKSPVGFVAVKDETGKITILHPLNDGYRAEQLINYRHDNNLTLLPSDIINVDGTLYMQAMWNRGIGNVLSTEIFRSTDEGKSWQSIQKIPTSFMGGMGNLITWEKGPDGYIYMMTTQFRRKDDVFLVRFRPNEFGDRSKWQFMSFNDQGQAVWSKTYGKILSQNVMAGEMSLRYVEGHWVLAMFNAETMSIEVRISKEIARDWNAIKPAHVVIANTGGWGAPQTPSNWTQLYGGYITPGSTLANMDLVVSQWNTSNNSRYMSTQFNVKGLDKFFGITPSTATGQQRVVQVQTAEVDPATESQLAEEMLMEEATDFAVVPLNDQAAKDLAQ